MYGGLPSTASLGGNEGGSLQRLVRSALPPDQSPSQIIRAQRCESPGDRRDERSVAAGRLQDAIIAAPDRPTCQEPGQLGGGVEGASCLDLLGRLDGGRRHRVIVPVG